MPIEIWVPIRTVSEANRREHWAARAKRARAQRSATLLALRCQRVDLLDYRAAELVRVLLVRTGRRLDDDNLRGALKSVRDGVADWRGVDDGHPSWEWIYAQEPGAPGVRVMIGTPLTGTKKADP